MTSKLYIRAAYYRHVHWSMQHHHQFRRCWYVDGNEDDVVFANDVVGDDDVAACEQQPLHTHVPDDVKQRCSTGIGAAIHNPYK